MEPLDIAIKMETEGKEFYKKASTGSTDSLGKALFARLAEEEDSHAARAREIHDALKKGAGAPKKKVSFDGGKELKSIFAQASKQMKPARTAASSELEAIALALEMEEKSRKFYQEQGQRAGIDFERQFFQALKQEEQGHYLSLVDYREYLTDPTGWFTRSEHISLDGG